MIDEREYIHRLNAAEPNELTAMLVMPTPEEERVLRIYLGDERYERMHEMALRAPATRGGTRLGNVVVIHGIMGAELTSSTIAPPPVSEKVWLNYLQLILGRFNRFRLDEKGEREVDPKVTVAASGMIKKYYGELLLSLQREWNVCQFWFDWRKDIRVSARQLAGKAAQVFGADAPFHIVAHSMGGLVARWYIKENKEKWDGDKSRLIMLGTPNFGSFAVPQIITALEGMVRNIALIDRHNDDRQIAAIANTFPGSYQMMPTPARWPKLYDATTWARAGASVLQAHLDTARSFHEQLADEFDERMIYVAGYAQDTIEDVASDGEGNPDVANLKAYKHTRAGDGRVPHALGFPQSMRDDGRVYFVFESHGSLPMNRVVQSALTDLLSTGKTDKLSLQPIDIAVRGEALLTEEEKIARDQAELAVIAGQTYPERGSTRSAADELAQASRAEELIVRGWIDPAAVSRTAAAGNVEPMAAPVENPKIRIRVERASITDVKGVDAIAVGVYIGVRPEGATLALDKAITSDFARRTREGVAGAEGKGPDPDKAEQRLITQLLERGIIGGGLAQPFFLDDPREGHDRGLIAIAGMGEPGRFGPPECMVLARELCWSLGRINRKHLATVLIGSGSGNLSTRDAVQAWLRGIRRALLGTAAWERLESVTFVEWSAAKVFDIDEAIVRAIAEPPLAGTFDIDYEPLSENAERREAVKAALVKENEKWLEKQKERIDGRLLEETKHDVPARMTVTFDDARRAYRFGAITTTAAIPEREVVLDPKLIDDATRKMAGLSGTQAQRRAGEFLRKLLIPREFRTQLSGSEPLVVLVDRQTARTPWEMLSYSTREDDAGVPAEFSSDHFLGTARGLTRQLRTTFAPPPEPPPPAQRTLNVLIVADPASDARLPGAEKEGAELRDLFESFNQLGFANRRVRVTAMLGPTRATRFAVLEELMSNDYDVLHFAGHCRYLVGQPSRSGWIFSNDEVLSANELNRIDRVPRFVFSNACESGVTPDAAELMLAPSFAEAFFARGVANFLCTAWPINDTAALEFAKTLYSRLLGGAESAPQQMYQAMTDARVAIAGKPHGAGTWGAYQHYGNPYYRFFEKTKEEEEAEREEEAS